MPTDARIAILASIRTALGTDPAGKAEADWAAIPRLYRRGSTLTHAELEELLMDRLRDYDAQVLTCAAGEVLLTIGSRLAARGAARILIPRGLPQSLLPEGFDFVLESDLTPAEMDRCDGVLTQCTLAIAETGTLVLQNVPGQGRRAASLIPDYHLCLVEVQRLVATVPEAVAALDPTATLPTTFISGPSATADIEMTRIKGVHGPRFLDVLLITS